MASRIFYRQSLTALLACTALGVSATPTREPGLSPRQDAIWQPRAGATWQIILSDTAPDELADVDIYDVDLFDNDKAAISELQKASKKVICYFSAGSWEEWRDDQDEFDEADKGGTLDGWPDEKWLDLDSDNVREIMLSRLDMAKEKGCDGVDPDNVDGYSNKENGLGLTPEQTVDYINFLSEAAHSRGLAIGLKNAAKIIPDVIDDMQWSVNEQCVQYEECEDFSGFIKAGKPVFHIEYPKGDDVNDDKDVPEETVEEICDAPGSDGFSTLIKNMDLDNWFQTCP